MTELEQKYLKKIEKLNSEWEELNGKNEEYKKYLEEFI